jgi:hypothetical protein
MEHLREVTDQGYRIQLDLSHQVLGLDLPEEESWSAQEDMLFPTLPRHGPTGFVSAASSTATSFAPTAIPTRRGPRSWRTSSKYAYEMTCRSFKKGKKGTQDRQAEHS